MILKKIEVDIPAVGGSNCYIVQDENSRETMVIDPGGNVQEILEMLETLNAKVKYILLTHCHGDHIGGVNELKDKVGGKVLIHRADSEGLGNPLINLSEAVGLGKVFVEADSRLDDEDIIHVGELEFKILHTPGHTQGGICVYSEQEKLLFSGDTLFRGAWGRTDLPTSNFEDIIKSITDKLMILEKDTIVYPGHGKATMIKEEKPIYLELKPKLY